MTEAGTAGGAGVPAVAVCAGGGVGEKGAPRGDEASDERRRHVGLSGHAWRRARRGGRGVGARGAVAAAAAR
jgi:hypothetical protein